MSPASRAGARERATSSRSAPAARARTSRSNSAPTHDAVTSASRVSGGRSRSFSVMSSTTLSVIWTAASSRMSQLHRVPRASNRKIPRWWSEPRELLDEERVPARLPVDQAPHRLRGVDPADQGVGDELDHRAGVQGAELEPVDRGPGLLDALEGGEEGMTGRDLVVAVPAEDQEVGRRLVPGQDLHQLEGGEVGPLEVVEEEHERVLGAGEGPDEPGKDPVQPPAGLVRADVGDRRLGAHEELDLGQDVGHDPAARPQGSAGAAPGPRPPGPRSP